MTLKQERIINGVRLHLCDLGDSIGIVWIERMTNNSGAGARVMQALCRYADKHGLDIHLSACGDEPGLIRYYECGDDYDLFSQAERERFNLPIDGRWWQI